MDLIESSHVLFFMFFILHWSHLFILKGVWFLNSHLLCCLLLIHSHVIIKFNHESCIGTSWSFPPYISGSWLSSISSNNVDFSFLFSTNTICKIFITCTMLLEHTSFQKHVVLNLHMKLQFWSVTFFLVLSSMKG